MFILWHVCFWKNNRMHSYRFSQNVGNSNVSAQNCCNWAIVFIFSWALYLTFWQNNIWYAFESLLNYVRPSNRYNLMKNNFPFLFFLLEFSFFFSITKRGNCRKKIVSNFDFRFLKLSCHIDRAYVRVIFFLAIESKFIWMRQRQWKCDCILKNTPTVTDGYKFYSANMSKTYLSFSLSPLFFSFFYSSNLQGPFCK